MQSSALLHLLQLASPSLPIGAYSYSQGLETAIDKGIVKDAASARQWLVDHLQQVVACFEAPLLWRLMAAFATRDLAAVTQWSEMALAGRDTAEFRAESVQMGYSLGKLILDLTILDPALEAIWRQHLQQQGDIPLPTAFACAAVALNVEPQDALLASLFSWVENQVLVCVKSIPLGQMAGQRLLLSLRPEIEAAAGIAMHLADDDLSNWAPGLSLFSMTHETQYSRLYRS
jgi:urease accessory protein